MSTSFRDPPAAMLARSSPDPPSELSIGGPPAQPDHDDLLAEESAFLHATIRRLVAGDDVPDHLLSAIPEVRRLIETQCTVLRTRRTLAVNRDPLQNALTQVLEEIGMQELGRDPDRPGLDHA